MNFPFYSSATLQVSTQYCMHNSLVPSNSYNIISYLRLRTSDLRVSSGDVTFLLKQTTSFYPKQIYIIINYLSSAYVHCFAQSLRPVVTRSGPPLTDLSSATDSCQLRGGGGTGSMVTGQGEAERGEKIGEVKERRTGGTENEGK